MTTEYGMRSIYYQCNYYDSVFQLSVFCSNITLLLIGSSHSGYIGEFEIVDDHRAGKIVVFLNGRLNKCGVISPRFDVALNDIEKWASNLLPSRQFG